MNNERKFFFQIINAFLKMYADFIISPNYYIGNEKFKYGTL